MKSAVGDPDWQSGNIVAQIGMTVESFRAYANSRNITLQYVNDGDVETNFVADYINKVMNNLLSNALKFTPEYGEVTVNVFHRDGFLHLSVADTGCGIDANNITHIFEPFYQGTASGHTGGYGCRVGTRQTDCRYFRRYHQCRQHAGQRYDFSYHASHT